MWEAERGGAGSLGTPFSAPFLDAARDVDGTLSFVDRGRSVFVPNIQYLMAIEQK